MEYSREQQAQLSQWESRFPHDRVGLHLLRESFEQEELDRIESEAYAQLEREEMEEAGLTVFENGQTVQDLAEQEMKYEERMHKFLFDDKYGVA